MKNILGLLFWAVSTLSLANSSHESQTPKCLVMGDSLAVGIGAGLPQCKTMAKVGVSSRRFLEAHLSNASKVQTNWVIVSLGSNDAKMDRETLEEIRRKMAVEAKTNVFVWVLPRDPSKAAVLERWVQVWGDTVVKSVRVPSRDGIHPTPVGYKTLAGVAWQELLGHELASR